MASVRERIVDAVVAALNAPGKPAGLTVHRSRTRPIDKDRLPAMVVYLATEDVGDHAAIAVMRTLRIRVECRVTGDPPDTVLDEHVTWAVKALKADEKLGGLAVRINEVRTVWDAAERDKVYAAAATEFEIEYATAYNDPEMQ